MSSFVNGWVQASTLAFGRSTLHVAEPCQQLRLQLTGLRPWSQNRVAFADSVAVQGSLTIPVHEGTAWLTLVVLSVPGIRLPTSSNAAQVSASARQSESLVIV